MEPSLEEEILNQLRITNRLLAKNIAFQQSWWIPIRNGILVGLGTVLGATILVSLFLAIVKPSVIQYMLQCPNYIIQFVAVTAMWSLWLRRSERSWFWTWNASWPSPPFTSCPM